MDTPSHDVPSRIGGHGSPVDALLATTRHASEQRPPAQYGSGDDRLLDGVRSEAPPAVRARSATEPVALQAGGALLCWLAGITTRRPRMQVIVQWAPVGQTDTR